MVILRPDGISTLLQSTLVERLAARGLTPKTIAPALYEPFGLSEQTTYPLLINFRDGYVFGRIGVPKPKRLDDFDLVGKRSRQLGLFLYAVEVPSKHAVICELQEWYRTFNVEFPHPPQGATESLVERVRALPSKPPRIPKQRDTPERAPSATFADMRLYRRYM